MKRLSITRAWNEAAVIVRRDAGILFTITFAFGVLPTLLMQILSPRVAPGQQAEAGAWLLLLIPVVVGSVLGSLAITVLALGRETVVRAAIAHALRRFLPVAGAALLLLLGFLLLSIPLIALLGPNPNNPTSFSRTLLVFTLLGLAFWTRFILLNPVGAAEPLGPVALIRRAFALSRGHFWRLLGFFLLALLAFGVVSLALLSVAGLLILFVAGRPEPGSFSSFLTLLLNGILSAIFAMLFTTMLARIYAQLIEGDAPTKGI